MTMKHVLILAAAIVGVPAAAQQSPAPPAAAALPAPDPARLALATQTVERIWPLGTYARMMNGTMDTMMNQMTASMFDMKPGDLVPGEQGREADKALGGKTMRQVMFEADPQFEERMRITNRVMMGEMAKLMTELEPQVRVGLARAYARKFDERQLADMNRFFATPSGAAYARESMMLFVDPEFIKMMGELAPRMMQVMPAMMEKAKAATAHLPEPRKPRTD